MGGGDVIDEEDKNPVSRELSEMFSERGRQGDRESKAVRR